MSFSLPSCVVLYPLPFHVILCFSYSVLLLIDAISILKARMGMAFFSSCFFFFLGLS